MHGGVPKDQLKGENLDALKKGFANLERHLQNVGKFGVPAVVAINKFSADTAAEHKLLAELCQAAGAKVILCNHWAEGSKGTEELAKEVVQMCERPNTFKVLYDDKATLWDKVNTIAKEIYRAENVTADAAVRKQFDEYQERYGHFPVCMAKTQSSFSTDPTKMGAPVNHTVHVRELRLSAGAEFVVAVCGEIMIMPGLPKIPSAERIYVKEDGQIEGLF